MLNLSETYTYEGHENWETGKRATAQKKIKTGDREDYLPWRKRGGDQYKPLEWRLGNG